MERIKELENQLRNVIESRCNAAGCKNCDLKWNDGCSRTDLDDKIMEIDMAPFIAKSND